MMFLEVEEAIHIFNLSQQNVKTRRTGTNKFSDKINIIK